MDPYGPLGKVETYLLGEPPTTYPEKAEWLRERGYDPTATMLSDLMEEVRSLRARLDELFPKADE